MEHFRCQQHQRQQQNGNGSSHQQRSTAINGEIVVIVFQQAKVAKHSQLIGGYAFAFADDVLSLEVDHRFHRFHGLLSGGLGGFLFDHHVGLHAAAKHALHNILEQGDFYLIAHDLQNGLDGLVHLPLADGGV